MTVRQKETPCNKNYENLFFFSCSFIFVVKLVYPAFKLNKNGFKCWLVVGVEDLTSRDNVVVTLKLEGNE